MSLSFGGPWRFEDRFGVEWILTLASPSGVASAPSLSTWSIHALVENLVFSSFSDLGAKDDARAAVLLRVYDALTNRALSRELTRPTVDPHRLLRNFSAKLRSALIQALSREQIRVDKVARPPWPFPDRPDDTRQDVEPLVAEQGTFVAFRLVDQDGEPVPRRGIHIVLADKTEQDGFLDGDGRFRLDGVAAGNCTVTFSDLDRTDFNAPNITPGQDESAAAGAVEADPPATGFVYTVESGDTLSRIADRYDFLHFATIWNDAANADLRAARVDPHVLLEGDQIVVAAKQAPGRTVSTGADTTFTVYTQKLLLKVETVDATGEPMTIDATTVQVDGADGVPAGGAPDVALTIPRAAQAVTFKIAAADDDGFTLSVGSLPPLREAGGPEARLENLGYGIFGDDAQLAQDDSSSDDPEANERLELAIELFQEAAGLDPTGDATDDVLSQLRSRAGV